MTTKCLHLKISSDEIKPCCIDCGLVQDNVSSSPYVRTITHYKSLLIRPPINCLVGENLKTQVLKFLKRQNRPITRVSRNYNNYIVFLRENEQLVLPHKERKKPLLDIYGEHRRIILEYIAALSSGAPE